MKALFSTQFFKSKGLLLLALTILLGNGLAACDMNIEITDEKRSLNKIGGTPPCAAGTRFSTGKTGIQTVRLFLVDGRQPPEALDLDGINKEPYNLKVDSFTIPTKDDKDNPTIQIRDAEDGSKVSDVKVKLEIVKSGTEPLVVQPNPRYTALKNTIGNKRVPKAISLLIDMSETAAGADNGQSRTTAPAGWILENFNSDSTLGDPDVFSTLLVRDGQVKQKHILFLGWDEEKQFLAIDGTKRGFILTSEDSKNEMSSTFTNIPNGDVGGNPPVYSALEAAIQNTRRIARAGDTGEALFNPAVILISLERDHHFIDKGVKNTISSTVKAAKGKTWDADADADFIPVMSIVYPAPDSTKVADWDKYIDELCKASQASGISKRVYWGQIFQVPVDPRKDYQPATRSHLDMAYHALKGYLEMKVKYTLSGAKSGKRYLISFKLQAELLKQKNTIDKDSPSIHFEVRVK